MRGDRRLSKELDRAAKSAARAATAARQAQREQRRVATAARRLEADTRRMRRQAASEGMPLAAVQHERRGAAYAVEEITSADGTEGTVTFYVDEIDPASERGKPSVIQVVEVRNETDEPIGSVVVRGTPTEADPGQLDDEVDHQEVDDTGGLDPPATPDRSAEPSMPGLLVAAAALLPVEQRENWLGELRVARWELRDDRRARRKDTWSHARCLLRTSWIAWRYGSRDTHPETS